MIPQPDEEYFANDHTAETMITLRTISQPMRLVTAVGAAGAGVQGGGAAVVQQSTGEGTGAEQGSRIHDANISYANIEVGNYNGWIPLSTLERI